MESEPPVQAQTEETRNAVHADGGDETGIVGVQAPGDHKLFLLYVLSVCSLGLYLMWWFYHVARGLRVDSRYRLTPYLWALGVVIPPIGCAVLYFFGQRVALKATVHRRKPRFPNLPCILFALFHVVLFFTPLGATWVPPLLLLPIPAVIVQARINRLQRRRDTVRAIQPRSMRARRIVVACGTPALVAIFLAFDLPLLRAHMVSSQARVEIAVGDTDWRITLPNARWKPIEASLLNRHGAVLRLIGPGTNAWLVAYVHQSPTASMERVTSRRRNAIMREAPVRDYQETIRFLDSSSYAPVSHARFVLGTKLLTFGRYQVVTAQTEDSVIEAVGFAAGARSRHADLEQLVSSIALASRAESQ